MDKNKITALFPRGKLVGLVLAASFVSIAPFSAAQADQININGGASIVSTGSGFAATVSVPTATVSNVDAVGVPVVGGNEQAAASDSTAINSLGTAGSAANSSYATGAAPEDAGMSGLTSNLTTQNSPSGLPSMQNGLMATGSFSNAGIPLWEGASYGFNTNPAVQTYNYAFGAQGIVNGLINALGGGIITAGPRLPATSTGSVNFSTAGGGGQGMDGK